MIIQFSCAWSYILEWTWPIWKIKDNPKEECCRRLYRDLVCPLQFFDPAEDSMYIKFVCKLGDIVCVLVGAANTYHVFGNILFSV